MSEADYSALLTLAQSRLASNSVIADACAKHLRLSLAWTAHFMHLHKGIHCDLLLRGCYGAGVESVSLVAAGLLRPAILSLRSHYELSLQFLFYKDHPIEWRNVSSFRTQPTLPGVNKKYLKDNFPTFDDRFKELSKKKVRRHEDCYDALSGVAHGTALHSISQATAPQDLVEENSTLSQAESIFLSAGEFLNDVHVSCFDSNWLSLPESTRSNLEARFSPASARETLTL